MDQEPKQKRKIPNYAAYGLKRKKSETKEFERAIQIALACKDNPFYRNPWYGNSRETVPIWNNAIQEVVNQLRKAAEEKKAR